MGIEMNKNLGKPVFAVIDANGQMVGCFMDFALGVKELKKDPKGKKLVVCSHIRFCPKCWKGMQHAPLFYCDCCQLEQYAEMMAPIREREKKIREIKEDAWSRDLGYKQAKELVEAAGGKLTVREWVQYVTFMEQHMEAQLVHNTNLN